MNHLLTFVFVVAAYSSCFSQMSIPVTSTIRTPYGNVPHTYYVPGPRMYYGEPNISAKYQFHITLNNDSTFMARTMINLPKEKENHSITIKSKKERTTLYPADTKSISRTTSDGMRLVGIPADSCWLFKTSKGKINSYSFVAEPGMDYVIAIQNGNDGPIVPLTKDNLLAITGTENEKVAKLIEKGKLIKAIEFYNFNQPKK
jgi:hypothetical protein